MQGSSANAALGRLFNTADLVNEGTAIVPIEVYDGTGNELASATECWLKAVPDMVDAKEISDRVWMFTAANLTMDFSGGV